MVFVRSFSPVALADARVLILGSMPGAASLAAGRYYAHPRNAFWPMLAEVCGFAVNASYEQRLAAVMARGIALWDVLQQCEREGSLDGDIVATTATVNDFATFLNAHPGITRVLCNGGAAFSLFSRRVVPSLAALGRSVPAVQMPSTSPAHAACTFAQKLATWRRHLATCLA